MAQRPERIQLTGSTLVRLLAGLIDPQKRVRDSKISFADALNQWTGWTESIALSKALDRPLAAGAGTPAPAAHDGHAVELAECERVRAQQVQAIAREVASAGTGPLDAGAGFAPFRHCHQARQQAMEFAVAPLRERVRDAVAACSPEAARLAAVDTVMADVLAVQERRLLATITPMLGRHFAQLCEAPPTDSPGDEDARRDLFRHDLQAVLLAELELRLQPVQGLLAALRQHQPQGVSS